MTLEKDMENIFQHIEHDFYMGSEAIEFDGSNRVLVEAAAHENNGTTSRFSKNKTKRILSGFP